MKKELNRKAGITISLQSIIGLVTGAIITLAIIFVFIAPAVSFFSQQALNTKMEKNLENLKETIALADEEGKEIIFDAQDFALMAFGKDGITCNVILPENCNKKGCVCACKFFRRPFRELADDSCVRGKCQEYDEDIKTSKDCGIVLKNTFENLIVTKKNNIINIDIKGK